jgi:serpin B
MKKVYFTLIFASLLFVFTLCSKSDPSREPAKPLELTTKQGARLSADNRFAFTVFKEVSAQNGPNTFFSPLSLNLALGMLYNGASGQTRTEMAQVLGMEDFTDIEINEYYQKMSQALLKIDPRTDISIANSIWHRDVLPVKQPFIDINKKYFDAMVKGLDFNKSDAADIINKWCADNTKQRIKEIIQSPIDPDVMMYLINALYFKSKWKSEFEKKNTKQDDFTKSDNKKSKVNMMEQTEKFPYYADDYLQCVEMPYGNQAFSMVAILPVQDSNIEKLIDYLDVQKWQIIINNLYEREVWIKLPRFKIECEIPLNEPVQNVGMKRIFYGGFDHISDVSLCVSNIKQKTFVEVNEEGTEAAAVTVIGIRDASAGPGSRVNFFANRPFLYFIKEKSTGVILFMGRMDEP